jgi:hypothetical protein
MESKPRKEDLPAATLAELRDLIITGHNVSAIKRYRSFKGCGLKEAKVWVERYIEELLRTDRGAFIKAQRATSQLSPVRLAIWSGPRNISTAMMRAWGARPDTFVCDEPLYGHYLQRTGLAHPLAAEIIASQETDPSKLVRWLTGPAPDGSRVFFQKQMSHHLTAEIGMDWLAQVTNCFFIRDPGEVIASYLRKNGEPTAKDIGFPQQWEIFQWAQRHTGRTPPVLDARDVLADPQRMLGLLCEAVGLEFTDAMLSWPQGFRATDGVWARHWYPEVENTTGFRPYEPREVKIPAALEGVRRECQEIYDRLYQRRLR